MDQEEFRRRLLKPLDQIHAEHRTISDRNQILSEELNNPDGMTLNQYVSNPTGKGTAYVAKREAIKNGLNLTFIKLLRESRKAFYAIPYIYPDGKILFYVKVPSEDYKNNKIAYDVLFLIDYDQRKERKNRAIKMYSNSPSFIFTYCYVYNKFGLIIDNLKDKIPIEALTKFPEIRNPIGSFGYEKSTYIAAKYLIEGRCLTDEYINRFGKTFTMIEEAALHRRIANPDALLVLYNHAKYQQRKTHRKELDENTKKTREERLKAYAKEQKKFNKQNKTLFIAPRAKITPRKAKRSLMNERKK